MDRVREKRPVAIVQARMGSSRLPGKVMKAILGRPMLGHIVERLRAVPALADVVVATSDREQDEAICAFCAGENIRWLAGSEADVLDRFYRAAVREGGDPLIRITADCPLVDPELVTRLMARYDTGEFDHVAVATGAGAMFLSGGRFPDGLDAECFSFDALARAWREATDALDREHVTPYIWRNKEIFRCGHLLSDTDYSAMRWTVDTEEDFALIDRIYQALYRSDRPFTMADVLRFLEQNPDLAQKNRRFIGQEGYENVWRRASEKK